MVASRHQPPLQDTFKSRVPGEQEVQISHGRMIFVNGILMVILATRSLIRHQAAYSFEDEAGRIFSDDADIRTVGWLGPEPVALRFICDIGLDSNL